MTGRSVPALTPKKRIAMTKVTQKSVLAAYAEKYPVSSNLWAAIQQDNSSKGKNVEVAIAMAKDILKQKCPIQYIEFDRVFNPCGNDYQPYSIMLMSHLPKFAKRQSNKRIKTVLGWVYRFLLAAGLDEQLQNFEQAISTTPPS